MMNDFYTINEFAKAVGVDYQTIYHGVKKGHINKEIFLDDKSNKFKYRIPKTELAKFQVDAVDRIIDFLNDLISGYKIILGDKNVQ